MRESKPCTLRPRHQAWKPLLTVRPTEMWRIMEFLLKIIKVCAKFSVYVVTRLSTCIWKLNLFRENSSSETNKLNLNCSQVLFQLIIAGSLGVSLRCRSWQEVCSDVSLKSLEVSVLGIRLGDISGVRSKYQRTKYQKTKYHKKFQNVRFCLLIQLCMSNC